MMLVFQDHVGDPTGDCLAACVASILESILEVSLSAAFRPEQRVYSRWGTRAPSGAWVSRGTRGTVERIGHAKDRFVVRWDGHPNETGWYSVEDLEA